MVDVEDGDEPGVGGHGEEGADEGSWEEIKEEEFPWPAIFVRRGEKTGKSHCWYQIEERNAL